MNETITYQWSERFAKSSFDAYYRSKLGRPWVMLLGGVVACTAGLIAVHCGQDYTLPLILMIAGAILLLKPIQLHFGKKRLCRDVGKLLSDPTITVVLTDDSITISSANSTRTVHWNKLSRLKGADSFLLLYCGTLLVASLPCEPFSEAQLDFIKSKIRKK